MVFFESLLRCTTQKHFKPDAPPPPTVSGLKRDWKSGLKRDWKSGEFDNTTTPVRQRAVKRRQETESFPKKDGGSNKSRLSVLVSLGQCHGVGWMPGWLILLPPQLTHRLTVARPVMSPPPGPRRVPRLPSMPRLLLAMEPCALDHS